MGHKGENSGGAQLWGAVGPLPAVGPCPWEVGAALPHPCGPWCQGFLPWGRFCCSRAGLVMF